MFVLMCAPRLCGHRRSQPLCRRARAPPLLPPQIAVFQRAGSGGVSSAQLVSAGRRCTCWGEGGHHPFQLFVPQSGRKDGRGRSIAGLHQKDSNQKTSVFLGGSASQRGGAAPPPHRKRQRRATKKGRTNGGGRHHPPTKEGRTGDGRHRPPWRTTPRGCPCLWAITTRRARSPCHVHTALPLLCYRPVRGVGWPTPLSTFQTSERFDREAVDCAPTPLPKRQQPKDQRLLGDSVRRQGVSGSAAATGNGRQRRATRSSALDRRTTWKHPSIQGCPAHGPCTTRRARSPCHVHPAPPPVCYRPHSRAKVAATPVNFS